MDQKIPALRKVNPRYRHQADTSGRNDTSRDEEEPEIRPDLMWVAGPSSIEIITKGEFNMDLGNIKMSKLIPLFREHYMSKSNLITAAEKTTR